MIPNTAICVIDKSFVYLFIKTKYQKMVKNPGQKQGRKSPEARKALDNLKKSAEKKKRMGLVEESFVSIDYLVSTHIRHQHIL